MSHLYKTLIVSVLFCSLLPASAEVYKWVDKNGKVHYSDKPIDPNAQSLEVEKERSRAQQEAARETKLRIQRQQKRINTQFEAERDAKMQQAEQQQQAQAHQDQCNLIRNEIRTLQMKVPVYYLDEQGKRVFYDDESRKQELTRLQKELDQHCQ